MEHEKIERINVLSRKQRSEGLTDEEKQEQAALRQEYLREFRSGMEAMLEGVIIKRPDGSLEPLKKRDDTQASAL